MSERKKLDAILLGIVGAFFFAFTFILNRSMSLWGRLLDVECHSPLCLYPPYPVCRAHQGKKVRSGLDGYQWECSSQAS